MTNRERVQRAKNFLQLRLQVVDVAFAGMVVLILFFMGRAVVQSSTYGWAMAISSNIGDLGTSVLGVVALLAASALHPQLRR